MDSLYAIHQRDFNPQGSREPRLPVPYQSADHTIISIHKALASLDVLKLPKVKPVYISIHKALASLDVAAEI